MIDKYNVNQFKFDGTGNADRVFPAAPSTATSTPPSISLSASAAEALHLHQPHHRHYSLALLASMPTPSGAAAKTMTSPASALPASVITYRDAQTTKHRSQRPHLPLNSLMLHASSTPSLPRTSPPIRTMISPTKSLLLRQRHQLQEMYITPRCSPPRTGTRSRSRRWSRMHGETLRDTHWIGGDPDKLQVYGWAAWSTREGILTLRNPSKKPRPSRST